MKGYHELASSTLKARWRTSEYEVLGDAFIKALKVLIKSQLSALFNRVLNHESSNLLHKMEDDEVEAYKELLSEKISEIEQLREEFEEHMGVCAQEKEALEEQAKADALLKEAMEEELDKLRDVAEEAEELRQHLEEADDLKAKFEELAKEHQDLQNLLEEKHEEIEEITTEFKTLYETYTTEKAELTAKLAKAEETAMGAGTSAAKIEELQNAVNLLTQENKQRLEALEDAKNDFAREKKEHIDAIEAKLALDQKATEELQQLNLALAAADAAKQELTLQVQQLEAKATELLVMCSANYQEAQNYKDLKEAEEAKVLDLQRQLKAEKDALANLMEKEAFQFEEFQKELYSVKRTNGEIESEKNQLGTENAELRQEQSEYQAKLLESRQGMEEALSKLHTLEQSLKESQEEVVLLRKSTEEGNSLTETDATEARKELNLKQVEIEGLQQQLKELTEAAETNQTELQDALGHLEVAAKKIEELQETVLSQNSAYMEQQTLLESSQELTQSLKTQVKALASEHESAIAKLMDELRAAKHETQTIIAEGLARAQAPLPSESSSSEPAADNGFDYKRLVEQVSMYQTALDFKDSQISELEFKSKALELELKESKLSLQTLAQETSKQQKHFSDLDSPDKAMNGREIADISPLNIRFSESADASIAFSVGDADGKSATDIVEELICLVSYNLREHRKALQLQSFT